MRPRLLKPAELRSTDVEELRLMPIGHTASVMAVCPDLFGFEVWELPEEQPGVGHPESVCRRHSVWLDQ